MRSPAEAGPTTFEAIGTTWRIGTNDGGASAAVGIGAALTQDDRDAVLARIGVFDRDWSRFRDDSLVSQIARAAGTWQLPADAAPLLELYRSLYELTDGRLSPLVGASLERLGYDASYTLAPAGPALPAPRWHDAIALRETPAGLLLDTVSPVTLDVGAAGKGYLVDIVGDLLAARGAIETVIDASGDVRVRGGRSIRVALENPANPRKAVGVVELRDAALCASATQRRSWGVGLHHILDAVTGRSTTGGVIATWAIAESALLADGLATALFLAEPARLRERYVFDWVRMFADGRLEASADFRGELFA
jgi:thiamine biosynthesis lipoprotein